MLATMLGSLREVVSSSACETLHPTLGVASMTSCGSSVAPRSPVPNLRLALLAVVRLNLILAVGVCVDRCRLLGGDVWRGLGVALEIADGCRVGDVGIVGVEVQPSSELYRRLRVPSTLCVCVFPLYIFHLYSQHVCRAPSRVFTRSVQHPPTRRNF